MKGFALDNHGDVIIEGNDVKLAYGTEHLVQKIRQVLSTNRGEWWLDEKEGVPVQKILTKDPNLAMVCDYVRSAVAQADSTLQLTKCEVGANGRTLKISFEAAGKNGATRAEMEV